METEPRPRIGAEWYKAHGLGNDYLVFEVGDAWEASSAAISTVCDRWRGVGGDGIVVLLGEDAGVPRLRMFNPDGSEFERSGNGLRVLASFLSRHGRVSNAPFEVEVGGERVTMTVHARDGAVNDISVDMGTAHLGPEAVGLDPAALDSSGELDGPAGERLGVLPVSVGNPHLVVFTERPSEDLLHRVGPHLAAHPSLRNGSNVQLASVDGPASCSALIWERGVGPTSASGTSACAVAVAAVSSGRVDPGEISVHMIGGDLSVAVSASLGVVLRGPVEEVCEGCLTERFLGQLR